MMVKEASEEEAEAEAGAGAEETTAKADPTGAKENKDTDSTETTVVIVEIVGIVGIVVAGEVVTVMTEEAKEKEMTMAREESIKISRQAGCHRIKNKHK